MNPGQLRHRIEIQQYTDSQNEIREKIKAWNTLKKVWARIDCVGNGRQQYIQGKEDLSLKYEITIRYSPEITESMRVIYKDKVYDIDSIVNYKELNKELHLFCTQKIEGVYIE